VQIAMKSHAVYRHEPRQMVSRLNEALWTHSTGHRFASLFYCVIDPESGSVHFASAGSVQALSCSPLQVRTVNEEQPMLGADPDSRFHQQTFVLEAGDSLLIFSRCQTVRSQNGLPPSFEDSVTHVLQSCEHATAEEQLRAVFESQPLIRGPERTVVVAHRLS
jgi:serine phosphatase RsbU (regulator of sigma subunit)